MGSETDQTKQLEDSQTLDVVMMKRDWQRTIAYLLAFVLAMPGVLMAAFFLLVKRETQQEGFGGLIWDLLVLAYHLFTSIMWVAAVIAIALIVAGLFARTRTLGSLCIFALALVSIIVTLVIAPPRQVGELAFHVFALLSMLISGRLIATEPKRSAPATPVLTL